MKRTTFLLITLSAVLLPAADSRAWVKEHAIPLRTAEAGHGFEDMQPLKKIVGDARVVSLGEATHGTREFFQLKHRMLEFLATEMGFTVFSIEANMPEAYRLNAYVLTGKGDPAALLKGMYFWTWDTEEVLAMIKWMREFNASGKGRVEFTGFDMQTPDVALKNVETFIAGRDPSYAPSLKAAAALVGGRAQTNQNFGVITYSLPAKDWAGKKVRLSGMIRTEGVTGGAAHLWMRANHEGKVKVFRNLGVHGVTGTSEWKRQSIEFEMPAESERVFLGGTFNGSGKVWFDDLALEVDSQPVPLANPGFESAARDGYFAGGTDTQIAFDSATFAGGKQSLRMERQGTNSAEPDLRLAVARWVDVVKHMEANRGEYREGHASPQDIEWAIQNARVVRQCLEMRAGTVSRDASMARNVEWILEQSPKAKVVLWAHNGHVAAKSLHGFPSMGTALRAKLGGQMAVFGFGFLQGSFQAVKMGGGLQDFSVTAAPAGSWDALMASSGLPLFALDLRQAPEELRQPMKARTIGSMYSAETAGRYWVEADMPANFDAFLFVESTTAARKNKTASFLTKSDEGVWLDKDTAVRFALPDGWAIAAERKIGTAETSIALLDARRDSGTSPALYYRVAPKPVTRTPEETEASLTSAMTAKPEQRQREGLLDYRNNSGSARRHEVNGHPALSWSATFTVNGQEMVESCTYVQSGTLSALFFAKMPAKESAAFEERWAPVVSSLRLP